MGGIAPRPRPKYSDPEFEEFYAAYPRREAKANALKEWKLLKFGNRLPPLGELLAAVEAQRGSEKWQKADGQYIPKPENWLKGECWGDQLKPARSEMGYTPEDRVSHGEILVAGKPAPPKDYDPRLDDDDYVPGQE